MAHIVLCAGWKTKSSESSTLRTLGAGGSGRPKKALADLEDSAVPALVPI